MRGIDNKLETLHTELLSLKIARDIERHCAGFVGINGFVYKPLGGDPVDNIISLEKQIEAKEREIDDFYFDLC